MRGISWQKRKRCRGQSLLESVLVTLVFLTLLIGILDVGQVLFVHQTLVERTRAALRWGAVRPFDADAIRNMVLYSQPTVPGNEDPPPAGLFGLTADNVTVERRDAGTNADRIVITLTRYPFRFFTPFIAGRYEGKPIIGSIPYEVEN